MCSGDDGDVEVILFKLATEKLSCCEEEELFIHGA